MAATSLRAAVLHEFGRPLAVEELELDPPKAGEVGVRMVASGVCHSDLHVAQGIHPTSLPVVLGHEGAGVVEEVGSGVAGLTFQKEVATANGAQNERLEIAI